MTFECGDGICARELESWDCHTVKKVGPMIEVETCGVGTVHECDRPTDIQTERRTTG